ncbi:hypothetical protein [Polaribacter sp. M15]
MKKVILSLVFVLSFSSLTIAIDKNKSEPDIEGCHEAASELAGLLAIWNNNSFEEEEDDYNYLMVLCLEA